MYLSSSYFEKKADKKIMLDASHSAEVVRNFDRPVELVRPCICTYNGHSLTLQKAVICISKTPFGNERAK